MHFLDLKKGFNGFAYGWGSEISVRQCTPYFCDEARSGVDIISVQPLLGHSKITMTARYAHSPADVKMAAVWKLDFAGSCSSPDPSRSPGLQMPVPEIGAKV